jgi:hypothetical protein
MSVTRKKRRCHLRQNPIVINNALHVKRCAISFSPCVRILELI